MKISAERELSYQTIIFGFSCDGLSECYLLWNLHKFWLQDLPLFQLDFFFTQSYSSVKLSFLRILAVRA